MAINSAKVLSQALSGLFADRPTASAVYRGARFYATDTQGIYDCVFDNTTSTYSWTLSADSASEVGITDTGDYFASDNVEGALQEVGPTMTDARTPTAHAASHGFGQTDAISIAASQISDAGDGATANFGSGSGDICEGDDSRLSDARTPTAHAASHAAGEADALTLTMVQISDAGTSATADIGSGAGEVCAGDDGRLSDSRTPIAHAASHSTGEADAIDPVNIGAEVAGAASQAEQNANTYTDIAVAGISGHETKTASETNINILVLPSPLGGYSIESGDLFLLTNQTEPKENGVWVFSQVGDPATRPSWFDNGAHVGGELFHVLGGTFAMNDYVCANTLGSGDVVGTDDLTFPRADINAVTLATLGACADDDSRLSDTRDPNAHAASHAAGEADALTLTMVQISDAGTAATADIGSGAGEVCAGDDLRLSDSRTPTAHAAGHAAGEADALTLTMVQISDAGTAATADIGSGAGEVCAGDDGRLSDARTPTAHAASHATGEADAIAPGDIDAIPIVPAAIENNFATFDASGGVKDSSYSYGDFVDASVIDATNFCMERFFKIKGSDNTDYENADANSAPTNSVYVAPETAVAGGAWTVGAIAGTDRRRNICIVIHNDSGLAKNLYEGVMKFTVSGTIGGVASTEDITFTSTAGNKLIADTKFRVKCGVKAWDIGVTGITNCVLDNVPDNGLKISLGLCSKIRPKHNPAAWTEACFEDGDINGLGYQISLGLLDGTNKTINWGTLADDDILTYTVRATAN